MAQVPSSCGQGSPAALPTRVETSVQVQAAGADPCGGCQTHCWRWPLVPEPIVPVENSAPPDLTTSASRVTQPLNAARTSYERSS